MMRKDKRFEREQGDINTTPNRRKYWERNLSELERKWFEEDSQYFLHQSLSTPVINVLSRAYGIYIEDLKGKNYIDMHGITIRKLLQLLRSSWMKKCRFAPEGIPIFRRSIWLKNWLRLPPEIFAGLFFAPVDPKPLKWRLCWQNM
jgi:hypothetical protein